MLQCNCISTSSLLCTYAEVVMRPYRWADDGWKHASNRSIMKMCNYQEQATYGDVLPDMASGYMLFHEALICLPHVCLSVASCHNVQAYLAHAVYICPPAASIIMWKLFTTTFKVQLKCDSTLHMNPVAPTPDIA